MEFTEFVEGSSASVEESWAIVEESGVSVVGIDAKNNGLDLSVLGIGRSQNKRVAPLKGISTPLEKWLSE